MKRNKIMWGFAALIVLTTIAITFGTLDSHSQQKPPPTPNQAENNGYDDVSKYAIADYDAHEPVNAKEREERKLKNRRYDGQFWVLKSPRPDTGKVGRHDDYIPPTMIPSAESDLVVIGEITGANAYLSTDKKNVYSEFTICVDEILKEDASNKMVKGTCVTADREGGFVRYPNGQKVLYKITTRDLPAVGRKYVLFLTNDRKSLNYAILTGYELKESTFDQLDSDIRTKDYAGAEKAEFIGAIRAKISESSKPEKTPHERKQD